MSVAVASAAVSVSSGIGAPTNVQVQLPSGETMLVGVAPGDSPVCAVKRAVAAKMQLSPLLQRVSPVGAAGPDSLTTVPRVAVTARTGRNASHAMRVHLMSERRVAGVSAWEVMVDAAADSVLDLKFLLSVQPAIQAAGLKPDYLRLYAKLPGQPARTELQDGQLLRESGALSLPAGRVVRVMFEVPSGVPGHGLVHSTRQTINEREDPNIRTMADFFLRSVNNFPNKPFLGTRSYVSPDKLDRGDYTWLTYAQSGARVANIGAGLRALGVQSKETVGIVSANRAEWTLVDMACNIQGFASVPLYDTLGPDAIQYIINHAQIRAVFASAKELKQLAAIRSACPSLEIIVAMDDTTWDRAQLDKLGKSMYSMRLSELERDGQAALDRFPAGQSHTQPDDVFTICYTSGTTGNPKGAILTHGNIIAACAGMEERATPEEKSEDEVFFSYLPLAHIYERICQANVIAVGGAIGFSQGDPVKLLEDVQALRPTIFPGVPRVWQRIYDRVHAQVASAGVVKSTLFNTAYKSKVGKLQRGELSADGKLESNWDRIVFNNLAALFGGRVKLMATGAAPLPSKVGDFMRTVFGANFVEGYGLTETCAALTCSARDDCYYGAVGAPLDCCLVKLVDVTDMEYLSTDVPAPRGEIWVSGPNVFQGYYKQPAETAESFSVDPQGRRWFMTGDVGTWLPDGSLKIIDRKKNMFKLSQGEYVRPEYIEGVYKGTPQLANVFVHGDSQENFLVAVVYPDPDALKAFCAAEGVKGATLAEQVTDPRVEHWLFQLMQETAVREKLRGFELVKRIHVSPADFTVESGLLTPTMKLKRNVAAKHFRDHITRMYKEGENKVAAIAAKL